MGSLFEELGYQVAEGILVAVDESECLLYLEIPSPPPGGFRLLPRARPTGEGELYVVSAPPALIAEAKARFDRGKPKMQVRVDLQADGGAVADRISDWLPTPRALTLRRRLQLEIEDRRRAIEAERTITRELEARAKGKAPPRDPSGA